MTSSGIDIAARGTKALVREACEPYLKSRYERPISSMQFAFTSFMLVKHTLSKYGASNNCVLLSVARQPWCEARIWYFDCGKALPLTGIRRCRSRVSIPENNSVRRQNSSELMNKPLARLVKL
jgi:hypothetical protein